MQLMETRKDEKRFGKEYQVWQAISAPLNIDAENNIDKNSSIYRIIFFVMNRLSGLIILSEHGSLISAALIASLYLLLFELLSP